MRACFVVLTLSLFSSCDGERGDALVEAQLDRRLAELMELKAVDDAAEKFVPVARVTPEELASLGADVAVTRARTTEFYVDAQFHGAGTRADAVQFIRALQAASRAVLVTSFTLRDGAWDVTAAVVRIAKPPPAAKPPVKPEEPTLCFGECRARQVRIAAQRAAVTQTETRFEAVLTRAQQRRELAMFKAVAEKFAEVSAPLLEALEKADWVPGETAVAFERGEVIIAAPKSSEADCQRSFEALGACRFDDGSSKLQVKLNPR